MAEYVEHQQQKSDEQHESSYGVLLYYKYTAPIEDLHLLYNFYETNCSSLGLLGRVRLATNGVNVTVGGKLRALEKHIEAVKENCMFEGTDFKLASCHEPLNDKVADECGFTSLSIRIVKELVTLGSNPLLISPPISSAGKHLYAVEFHSLLKDAVALWAKEPGDDGRKLVLLDARNLYETRIGKFDSPSVETLDPAIRQYSDLPTWIDNNLEQLRGNTVLMYCTGGIRCEMASAYVRSKGVGFENVFQLYGGVQRYLEQFPDGGFFKGKNFVFDHRISVGSSDGNIMGNCLLCGVSFDDYSSRNRCSLCRMLVLVCYNCQDNVHYVCELCQSRVGQLTVSDCKLADMTTDAHPSQPAAASSQLIGQGVSTSRKLRILCLHGFRQNASSFKGRTASLAKKLKSMVEFVFVDAPHEVPFIYQPTGEHNDQKSLFDQENPPPAKACSKKYAWLVSPAFRNKEVKDWEMVDTPFDPLQYQEQTEGFDESFSYIKTVLSQQGPFDGILGFSQGAAMAALVCAKKERLEDREMGFRFVILCSGFRLNLFELHTGSINCPSLHVYGKHLGKDRQITSESSRDLASLFEERTQVVIEHDSGHLIPTKAPYIDEIRSFLRPFA